MSPVPCPPQAAMAADTLQSTVNGNSSSERLLQLLTYLGLNIVVCNSENFTLLTCFVTSMHCKTLLSNLCLPTVKLAARGPGPPWLQPIKVPGNMKIAVQWNISWL